jgi:hypothetical protein
VSLLPPSSATVIGIDVGGSRKGFHAVALTQEIVHACRERIGASVIATASR